MAASSSRSSFIVDIGEEYPCPSHVRAQDHVTVKLSGNDRYNAWKTQILCLLVSHDMFSFIDGRFVRSTGNSKRKVGDLEAWTRSDALVKSWILGSVSVQATMDVVERLRCKIPNADFTAKDLWDELECIYGPEINPPAIEDKSQEEETNVEERKTLWEYRKKQMLIENGFLPNEEEEREKIDRKEAAHKKLYEGIVKREMDLVNEVLVRAEVTVTDKIFNNGNTALHVAVMGTSNNPEFLLEMLEKTPEDISLTDLKNLDGSTLLHMAAIAENYHAANIFTDKYPNMLFQTDNEGHTPLELAFSSMHTSFYWRLTEIVRPFNMDALFTDKALELAISSKSFGLARNMIWWRCKKLNSDAVLMAIAQNYPSELSFWESIAAEFKDTPILNGRIYPYVRGRLGHRDEAFEVLKAACKLIKLYTSSSRHKAYYTNPVLEATRLNALEVVKVLVYHFPDAFWSAGEDGHNVIQHAVINRSEKIYNLLYQMSEHKNVYQTIKDSFGNNLLHLAARLAPTEKLNLISGAALQIQYELQWYKEVERFVCPLNITEKNSFEETPRMVFTRTHKALVSDGEKWMKSTAESYTITAALITTIVFAAAITVPGGNNQDTGVPIFTDNPAFTIFAVSDAISLFTAVMSLLMFLSILTARFAEEDFLIKLPRKLIIGLVTLFISTTTMIIAFGAALFIVFGQKNALLLIPIGVLTSLTIAFFVALQFPLVVDLMRSTYGSSIFGRRNATFKKRLQNYIHKMTRQPIVEDNKEEREVTMEIDWNYNDVKSFCADDMPFNI